jgi:hypothetical protein
MRALSLLLAAVPGVVLLAACGEATAPEPTPAHVQRISGDGQEVLIPASAPEPLVVQVVDRTGEPVPGVAVQWTASKGILAETSTTDSDGLATNDWYVDFLGPATATASVRGLIPVHFSLSGRMLIIELTDFAFEPGEVFVGEGPAEVRVSARAYSEDRVGAVVVRFADPENVFFSEFLALADGTPADGSWEAVVEIPHGAVEGTWTLHVTVAGPSEEGCRCLGYPRVLYPASSQEVLPLEARRPRGRPRRSPHTPSTRPTRRWWFVASSGRCVTYSFHSMVGAGRARERGWRRPPSDRRR